MRIREIVCKRTETELKRPFDIAGGKSNRVQSIVVKLISADGLVGIGEAVPMPAYSGQTVLGVLEALEQYIAEVLIDVDIESGPHLHRLMRSAIKEQAIAKAAVDIAFHDLICQSLQIPLHEYLGGRVRNRVELSWAIGLGEIAAILDEASEMIAKGFHTLKVKVGLEAERDLEVIARLREQVGDQVALRIDANEGYSLTEAERVLAAMERYRLELIEQPIPAWNARGLSHLKRLLTTPIMVDEGLKTAHDALELIRVEAVDIFNIKLMRVGGIHPAREISALAESAGIPCMVGSMPELGIATAAGIHFALTQRPVEYACDLIGPLMVVKDIACEKLYTQIDGRTTAIAGDDLGLGVSYEDY